VKCKGCIAMASFPLITDEGKLSGKWAYHFSDVHGVPVDIFELKVNEILRREIDNHKNSL
jgi:hypothetical protein